MSENQFALECSSAKSSFESNLINNFVSGNQAKIFQYIRSITKAHSIPSTIFYNNSSASNDDDKATLFNQFFYSVFSTTTVTLPSDVDTLDPSVNNHLVSITITEVDVYNALSSLNINKATGIDGIGPKILNYCAISLFKPLHYLFSLSLRKHALPSDWLIHTIVPVYKSGDKTSANNYRPISLLCNTSKVLEQLIYDKVFPHILK